MKKFFEFFAKRHMLATLLTLIILMLGLGSLLTIKRDIFPNVDFGVMEIATFYPGASPEDVELNVTNKIEDQLKNVVGIDKIISVSLENLSHIQVILDPDIKDIEKVKWDIRDSVGRVTDFPDAVTETPLITEIDTSLMQIIDIGITAFEGAGSPLLRIVILYPFPRRLAPPETDIAPAVIIVSTARHHIADSHDLRIAARQESPQVIGALVANADATHNDSITRRIRSENR